MPAERVAYLTLDEALAIHQRLVERFGGAAGIRDLGLLESALYRPRTGYYRDLAEMATALLESLLRNHPFLDGNKRMAFFAADVFLRLNGWRLEVEPQLRDHRAQPAVRNASISSAAARIWRSRSSSSGSGSPPANSRACTSWRCPSTSASKSV